MPLQIERDATFEQFIAEWRLPADDPRSRELYDEAVHAAEVYATLTPSECPFWCALPAGHEYEPDTGSEPTLWRTHVSRVDGAHVHMIEYLHGDGRIEYDTPEVYVRVDNGFASQGSRSLAAQLVAAADLVDTITGAAK